MIYHLSQDLMLVGKVSSAANAAGVEYRSFSSVDRMLAEIGQKQAADGCCEVFVDLQLPRLDFDALMGQLRGSPTRTNVIAYAQHVKTDLLERAREAEPERVMTRGQFDQNVGSLVQHAADAPGN